MIPNFAVGELNVTEEKYMHDDTVMLSAIIQHNNVMGVYKWLPSLKLVDYS